MLSPRTQRYCFFILAVLYLSLTDQATATADTLRVEIETLASEQGFRINGADLIGEEKISVSGEKKSADQIDQLLANYNFVVTRDSRGRISQLTIVGMRVSPAVAVEPDRGIQTKRQKSAEHYVEAMVEGPNGRELSLNVMVDTGASTLVLPRSLITSLGYAIEQLRSVTVQTANGVTEGLSGTLQSVRVGDAQTSRVAVTFVEDRLLGGKHLLGMSFLGRFRMTIDGGNGLLQLEEQRN